MPPSAATSLAPLTSTHQGGVQRSRTQRDCDTSRRSFTRGCTRTVNIYQPFIFPSQVVEAVAFTERHYASIRRYVSLTLPHTRVVCREIGLRNSEILIQVRNIRFCTRFCQRLPTFHTDVATFSRWLRPWRSQRGITPPSAATSRASPLPRRRLRLGGRCLHPVVRRR